MSDETEVHDWGGNIEAFLEWRKAHPLPEIKRTVSAPKDTTDVDPMFATTTFERASTAAYGRMVDAGHRA